MSNEVHEIPIVAGSVFTEDASRPVQGGHSRYVPNVPVGKEPNMIYMPCLWKSHYVIQAKLADGSTAPANECLLLAGRQPLVTLRAEISVDSWQHFGKVLIEW